MSTLTEKSTLEELFEFITPEEGVQAMPVTMNNTPDGKAQMMLIVAGEHNTASVIMANVMSVINEMYDTAEQQAAMIEDVDGNKIDEDASTIILPD